MVKITLLCVLYHNTNKNWWVDGQMLKQIQWNDEFRPEHTDLLGYPWGTPLDLPDSCVCLWIWSLVKRSGLKSCLIIPTWEKPPTSQNQYQVYVLVFGVVVLPSSVSNFGILTYSRSYFVGETGKGRGWSSLSMQVSGNWFASRMF